MQNETPQTKPCENCGAPLPLTGTFCLACNTPVSAEASASGLSVAETHAVRRGRPLMGVTLVGGVVLVVVALVVALMYVSRPHDDKDARAAVANGVRLLVKAEGGKLAACKKLTKYLAGSPTTFRPQCRTVVGSDPGAHLTAIKAGAVHLTSNHGTVHLSGTIVDAKGSRPLSADFKVSNETSGWLMDWDGSAIN